MSAGTDPSFYITTAIDYPNGAPHIGHSLEKVAADVVGRFHRLVGDDVAFCMGLDENSQHILRAAADNGMTPREWTALMDVEFRKAWDALGLSRNAWVQTTDPRHFRASTELFSRAQANGDIYKANYAGWYCPNCNNYYTEDELIDGHCPLHPTITPEYLEEENYFFALSNYTDILLKHLDENPEFVTPAVWRPEMISLLKSGLRDFSVSRQVREGKEAWGVPVPGDPDHVMYVWFDALTTYLTAIGFPDNMERFNHYWPADSQIIGKDIMRFHVLYWPAMLLSVAAYGAGTIAFGFSTWFPLSVAMLIFLGGVDNISVVVRHVLVQVRTPDHLRGRVSAVNSVFIESSNELGAFESGLVARLVSPVFSVVSGGIGTILVVLGIAWVWPEVRRLGRLELPDKGDPNTCAKCGYDLRGSPGPKCPECGQVVPAGRG